MRRPDPGTSIFAMTSFSTPKITPSLQRTPTAVPLASMALLAYSTWYRRPSGEKVETLWSYCGQAVGTRQGGGEALHL